MRVATRGGNQNYRQSIPVFLWMCLGGILFGAVQPLFGIYLPKLALDLVTQGVTLKRLWRTLAIFGLLCLSVFVASAASQGKIAGEKTAIYISHRLSSCRFCDKIAVFDNGELVQTGTHEELLADEGGVYASLWNAQAKYYEAEV